MGGASWAAANYVVICKRPQAVANYVVICNLIYHCVVRPRAAANYSIFCNIIYVWVVRPWGGCQIRESTCVAPVGKPGDYDGVI